MKTSGIKSLVMVATVIIVTGLTTESVFAQRGGRGGGGFHGGFGHVGGWGGYHYGGRGWGGYRPYYGYSHFYRPYLGFSLGILPFGYYPFYYGDDQFYYSGGLFYRQYNDQYKVVAPPVGAEVPKLPSNAQQVTINGQRFYEYKGVYYTEGKNEKGKKVYIVAGKDGVLNTDNSTTNNNAYNGPLIGDIVNELPQDSKEVLLKGQKFFVSPDGVYYEEQTEGDKVTYKVVGL